MTHAIPPRRSSDLFVFVPLLARNRESNEGVFADAQQLFLAVEAVFQAPQFRAARLHEQVQTAAIGQFVSPLTLGGIFYFKFLQSHLGVSPVLLTDLNTPKNTPKSNRRGWSQRVATGSSRPQWEIGRESGRERVGQYV